MMKNALQRLKSFFDYHSPQISDKVIYRECYVTEQDVVGLGRCVMKIDDVRRAIDSYTNTIRRYAFHVNFFIFNYISLMVNHIKLGFDLSLMESSCCSFKRC